MRILLAAPSRPQLTRAMTRTLNPKSRMQDLAHTIRKRLAERPHFLAPRRPPTGFEIDHYAGRYNDFTGSTIAQSSGSCFCSPNHPNFRSVSIAALSAALGFSWPARHDVSAHVQIMSA